jgi:hypothetical protein
VELEFAVFTREAFGFQRIAGEAGRLRRLGVKSEGEKSERKPTW